MRMAICAVAAVVWAMGAGGHPDRAAPRVTGIVVDSNPLASKLTGTWTGGRHDSASSAPQAFTMTWKKDTTGSMTGTVKPGAGPAYEAKVVWSADTGFVIESAPHSSKQLHEQVVTRMVSHLKGDSLWGTFEMRPAAYKGRSAEGSFTAAKQS